MKILRLLNKKHFSIILILFFWQFSFAEDAPIDIWNLDTQNSEQKLSTQKNDIETFEENNTNKSSVTDIYKLQSQKKNNSIEQENNLNKKEIKIIGLYDPDDYGLDINMWVNSDGDQLRNLFSKLNKLDLSKDANEILRILLLTNSYYPNKNISEEEFIKLKSSWLIKNSDLKLIEEYLIKNQILDTHSTLTTFLVNQYLSEANIKKACKIFSKNSKPIIDEYLSKFNIYCLIVSGKKEEAQLYLDLKKELGFKNKYFENKINFLLGYDIKIDESISEKSILDFHLAHRANSNFSYEPNEKTNKLIWKYLSSSNLLKSIKKIEISELNKISILEKATHNKNYPEKDLLEIYKRFQFDINQLLNAEESYKLLSEIESRALIYQRILLESEIVDKLKLLKILKSLFKKNNLENAFDIELKNFLQEIDPMIVPDNLTSFYYTNVKMQNNKKINIKFDNDVLHQSRLVNYFNGDYSKSKIEKDIESFLKKIKKDKKYFFSKKDQIFLESLKYDGIKISKKYDDLYEINNSEIPTDIKDMINNDEKAAALLRIVEVIGQDDLERIDEDTLYFIISTLNQLNIDLIRNNILLKVLPLKV
ncbi:hypothetical protein OAT07_01060 [Candidatus Pelagibacter sp.]|nr:hypothetical protein [Candidatus Pelagibacter sp.]